jgi:class 3 adenylate cyclase
MGLAPSERMDRVAGKIDVAAPRGRIGGVGTLAGGVASPQASPAVRPDPAHAASVVRIAAARSTGGAPRPADAARASVRAARRAFVTVLFTDVVDSTRRAAEMGDRRWLDLQGAHEAMSVAAVRRFRGRVLRTMGDGLLATFGTPLAAALCAARVSEASSRFGIDIRAGLHAGECERRGRRLGGLVFHVGARIAALAGPGQVLMSRTTVALLDGADLECRPYGHRELKGLAGRWDVWELRSREGIVT